MTTHYLSLNGFGERIGIARSTLATYRAEGRLPEPDAIIGGEGRGGTQGWLPETVDYWATHRVGQGTRTDLARRALVAQRIREKKESAEAER